ncbi:flippase activity-associated protein Agl23 [bacterium]
MNRNPKFYLYFGIIVLIAAAIRLPNLSYRPMHTDEAVHGIKLGQMLQGEYRYDPHEYHGPTLNLFTIPIAWIQGQTRLEKITETTLRSIPVLFSLLTILLLLGFRQPLGDYTTCLSALFLALSPVFVFYNRYYIHETLLLFFTTGLILSGYRFIRNPSMIWSLLIGIFLGFMHATKETWILSCFALIVALMGTKWVFGYKLLRFQPIHIFSSLIAMLLISSLIHSNLFTYPKGIIDSWLTYGSYFSRGAGDTLHNHPWFYYFHHLLFYKISNGPIFSELVIFIFGISGIIFSFSHKQSNDGFIRFMIFYALILTLIYSCIPYKTPWSLLGFWWAWIILAGFGAYSLFIHLKKPVHQILLITLYFLGLIQLSYQNIITQTTQASHPHSPWTYAHPDRDIYQIETALHEIALNHTDGKNIHIDIIFPNSEYWPLPWLLRDFHLIGWWDHVDMVAEPAPVILISPVLESKLTKKLYELAPPGERDLYVPLFDNLPELRPGAPIQMYMKKDTWDQIYG